MGSEITGLEGAYLTLVDSAAGTDVPALAANVPSSDSGTASEAPTVLHTITLTDANIAITENSWILLPLTDSGAALEVLGVQANVPISDSGAGGDTWSLTMSVIVLDLGAGSEYATMLWTIIFTETGLLVDIAYRLQGIIEIDDLGLPHVQRIHVSDPTLMSSKLVSGELPTRQFLGKTGRTVEIEGWTDSLATLDEKGARGR